mmetsp:Transcript_9704/g.20124  ORF Transcript_9704/g.20124 Transcript_9704/m.20124 type:complete len:138 (+) Transcript_9704:180-593(+)
MLQTSTMTSQNEPSPAAPSSSPAAAVPGWMQPNKTKLQIKKAVTGVHFLSLMATGILYAMKHEKSSLVFRLAILTFCLAYIIPPVGMISPDDAPEYAKTSMSYLPKKVEISTEQLKGKGDKKNKEKGGKKKRRNKEE